MAAGQGSAPGGAWAGWRRSLLLTAVGLAVFVLERQRRARPRVEPQVRHIGRNLSMAGLAAATVHLVETPVVMPAARWAARRGVGLSRLMPGPSWVRTLTAVLLLDYTLYLWHMLVHRVPFLWRFHLVHHVDLDLDATTALRFHGGELALSVPWRAAQVIAIGATPQALVAWQTLTLMSVLFHHSNSLLPAALERRLSWLLVTPRMHAIHHSVNPRETDSNYSSGLAIWDRLHRTILTTRAADEVVTGVEGYLDVTTVGLDRILELPWTAGAGAGAPTPPRI